MKPLEALAATLGLEYESRAEFINSYGYQNGRHPETIITAGEHYYCAQKKKPKSEVGSGDWQILPDDFWAKQAKTNLWISHQE